MKLSDLRPCDNCGGPVGTSFNLIRHSLVVMNAHKANRVLGMSMMFDGSLQLAEVMGTDPDCVTIAGEFNPALWTDFYVCNECYYKKFLSILALMEKRIEQLEKAQVKA